ncbi:short coiled-coil protein isoform X2 [Malurus melanocephalus]|nr:short coiled-coil protein isoform X2 [Malurus melanocephalus]
MLNTHVSKTLGRGSKMELHLDEEDGTFTSISLADDSERSSRKLSSKVERSPSTMMNADMDAVEAENQVELEEKTRLINQVLELQHTLEDLSARVDAVKEENLKLKSENQVLGQYIENLMSASSVFQTTDTKSKRK